MLTKQAINTLTPICEELLSDEIDFLNLKKAVTQLQSFLNTISKIRQEFMEGKIDKTTSYSKRNEDVFILNKETVLSQSEFNAENIPQFPLREIMFQSGEIEDFDEIAIGTEIKIFDSEILSLNESGLTMPLTLLREKKPIQVRGIETQYLISNSPEIKTKFIT